MASRLSGACAVGALAVAFLGACASDDNDDASSVTSATVAETESADDADPVLGEPNAASAEAVAVGYIADGATAAGGDFTSSDGGVEAGIAYANEYLGGMAGHEVALSTCETQQTPEGAASCANEMVRAGVVAVLMPVSTQAAAILPILEEAGIPLVMYSSQVPDVLTSDSSFVLSNAVGAAVAGAAAYARDSHHQRAAVVMLDSPATVPVSEAAQAFYGRAGVELEVIRAAADVPDMSPQIQVALGSDPQQVAIIGPAAFCQTALQGVRTLGYQGDVLVIQACIDQATVSAVPGGFEGVLTTTTTANDPESEDVQRFQAVMSTFAPDAPTGGLAQNGYVTAVALALATSGIESGAEVNAESVLAAMQSMDAQPLPLGGGMEFQCDGERLPATKAVCSSDVLLTTLEQDGSPTTFERLDVLDIVSS